MVEYWTFCQAPGQGPVKIELNSSSQVKNNSTFRGIDLEQTLKLVLHPPPPTHHETFNDRNGY